MHLCLGLISGTILFLVALSGALYCFAPEIQALTQPYRKITPASGPVLSAAAILSICEEIIPGEKPGRIYYHGTNKALEIVYYRNKKPERALFVHPYNGRILKDKNLQSDPIQVLFYFHRTLLLPKGELITGSATFLFLFLLVSGIWLWWPRNKAASKQRFRIKWTASPKRLGYDLHSTIGFYSCWLGILFAITGLSFSFPWFAKSIYAVTGASESSIVQTAPVSVSADSSALPIDFNSAVDLVWKTAQQDAQKYKRIMLVLPAQPGGPILLRGNPDPDQLYRSDFRYFNQFNGKEIVGDYVWGNYVNATVPADYLKRMNYDIHTGAILGLPGRILAFIGSLLIASLPVTGFLLWKRRPLKEVKGEK
ncbi:MAG: PepSY domain-containing protein [Flavipsychrobacter sp.]|nr:PepSY domain-containing protein [Flavipsychrobacter sp.]